MAFHRIFDIIVHLRIPISIGVTAGSMAYEAYGNKRLATFYQQPIIDGKPIPGVVSSSPCISSELQELINEVTSRLNLPQKKKNALEYYATGFPKPEYMGFWTPYSKIRVFLPDYLNITDASQLKAGMILNMLKLEGQSIDGFQNEDWTSLDGIALINSFLLSRRAKKFLITQASYSRFNPELHLRFLILAMNTVAVIVGIAYLKDPSKTAPGPIRLFVGTSILLSLCMVYFMIVNQSNVMCDAKGLAQALSCNRLNFAELKKLKDPSMLDEEMLEGALEYFGKLIIRNKSKFRIFEGDWTSFASSLAIGEGESMNPFKLELPKKEIMDVLVHAKSLLTKNDGASDEKK